MVGWKDGAVVVERVEMMAFVSVAKMVETMDGKTVASKFALWAGPRDVLKADELVDLSEM
jgi:hypothetical protein